MHHLRLSLSTKIQQLSEDRHAETWRQRKGETGSVKSNEGNLNETLSDANVCLISVCVLV